MMTSTRTQCIGTRVKPDEQNALLALAAQRGVTPATLIYVAVRALIRTVPPTNPTPSSQP